MPIVNNCRRLLTRCGDPSLRTGVFLLQLLGAVAPDCVVAKEVLSGATERECTLNARYAISCAHKMGCRVFLTWEDIAQVKPKMVLTLLAAAFQQDMLRRKLGKEDCVGLVQKWTEEAAAENANAAAAAQAAAQAAALAAVQAAEQAQLRNGEESGAKSDTSDESVDTRSPSHSVGDEPDDQEALARMGWLAWALAGLRTAFGLNSPKGGGGTALPKPKRQRTDGPDGANGADGSSRLTNQGAEEHAPFYLDIGADDTQPPPVLESGAASTVGDLPVRDLPKFDQNDTTGNSWDVQSSALGVRGADGAHCPSRRRSCSGGSDGPQLSRGARRTSMRTSIHLTYGEL